METPKFPLDTFEQDFNEVYEPAEDTFLLIDTLEKDLDLIKSQNPLICVEVGCGSGAVITSLAKSLGRLCLYFATDINPKATLTTQKCAKINNIDGVVNVVVGDLASPFINRLNNHVDLLIFNPPYVPTHSTEVGNHNQISSSWAGGLNGREVIDRFLYNTVPLLLSPNGVLYLIIIKENNVNEICDIMTQMGFHMTIVFNRKLGIENLMSLRFSRLKNT